MTLDSGFKVATRTAKGKLEPLMPTTGGMTTKVRPTHGIIDAQLDKYVKDVKSGAVDLRHRMNTIQAVANHTYGGAESPIGRNHIPLNRNTVVGFHSGSKSRFHPNSLDKSSAKKSSKMEPPTMPAQNPQMRDSQKMASYLHKLDTRLSQPKLMSPSRSIQRNSSLSKNAGPQNNVISQTIDYPADDGFNRGSVSNSVIRDSLLR